MHTLVRRQIEVPAKYLGITNKVHGFDSNRSSWSDDFWEEARHEYEEEVVPMEIEVAGNETSNETSRDNGSIDDNGGSVDAVVDIVVEVHNEVDMASEALSAAVESDNNGVVDGHDGVGIGSFLSQNDEEMSTRNAHHCAIC
jgi:hypothetical protein